MYDAPRRGSNDVDGHGVPGRCPRRRRRFALEWLRPGGRTFPHDWQLHAREFRRTRPERDEDGTLDARRPIVDEDGINWVIGM